jgi:glycerol-3-phosphate O-acyltransferase / dihydroxyacetone phosphate acyltransferase
MRVPILYRISRVFVRIGVYGYFRRLEITGQQNIPSDGPVIFASNHPHSITDALLLGLGTGRMLHFIAHSGLFRSRFKAWFLRSSGVIPVYRPKDVEGAPDKNTAMFAACHDVLRQGASIGIFPEGTSEEERRVQKLKTGTARIALSAEKEAQWQMGLTIVPVGLNFESRQHFRSQVLVRFGKPIVVAEFKQQYSEDEVKTVNELTARLQDSLRREVVNVERSEFDTLLRNVVKVYKCELMERIDLEIPGETLFEKDQTLNREFARALDFFYDRSPEVIWGLARMMEQYQERRHELRLRDELLREEEGPSVRAEMIRFLVMGAMGLPLAIFGSLGNALPYELTGLVVRLFAVDLTKRHSFQFLAGLVLFLGWYSIILMKALPLLGGWLTLALSASLPLTGLFARQYMLRMRKRRRWLRFAWLEFQLGYKIRELRQMRRRLIRELDASLSEYLRALKEES